MNYQVLRMVPMVLRLLCVLALHLDLLDRYYLDFQVCRAVSMVFQADLLDLSGLSDLVALSDLGFQCLKMIRLVDA